MKTTIYDRAPDLSGYLEWTSTAWATWMNGDKGLSVWWRKDQAVIVLWTKQQGPVPQVPFSTTAAKSAWYWLMGDGNA